jgi:hypothetical protein
MKKNILLSSPQDIFKTTKFYQTHKKSQKLPNPYFPPSQENASVSSATAANAIAPTTTPNT